MNSGCKHWGHKLSGLVLATALILTSWALPAPVVQAEGAAVPVFFKEEGKAVTQEQLSFQGGEITRMTAPKKPGFFFREAYVPANPSEPNGRRIGIERLETKTDGKSRVVVVPKGSASQPVELFYDDQQPHVIFEYYSEAKAYELVREDIPEGVVVTGDEFLARENGSEIGKAELVLEWPREFDYDVTVTGKEAKLILKHDISGIQRDATTGQQINRTRRVYEIQAKGRTEVHVKRGKGQVTVSLNKAEIERNYGLNLKNERMLPDDKSLVARYTRQGTPVNNLNEVRQIPYGGTQVFTVENFAVKNPSDGNDNYSAFLAWVDVNGEYYAGPVLNPEINKTASYQKWIEWYDRMRKAEIGKSVTHNLTSGPNTGMKLTVTLKDIRSGFDHEKLGDPSKPGSFPMGDFRKHPENGIIGNPFTGNGPFNSAIPGAWGQSYRTLYEIKLENIRTDTQLGAAFRFNSQSYITYSTNDPGIKAFEYESNGQGRKPLPKGSSVQAKDLPEGKAKLHFTVNNGFENQQVNAPKEGNYQEYTKLAPAGPINKENTEGYYVYQPLPAGSVLVNPALVTYGGTNLLLPSTNLAMFAMQWDLDGGVLTGHNGKNLNVITNPRIVLPLTPPQKPGNLFSHYELTKTDADGTITTINSRMMPGEVYDIRNEKLTTPAGVKLIEHFFVKAHYADTAKGGTEYLIKRKLDDNYEILGTFSGIPGAKVALSDPQRQDLSGNEITVGGTKYTYEVASSTLEATLKFGDPEALTLAYTSGVTVSFEVDPTAAKDHIPDADETLKPVKVNKGEAYTDLPETLSSNDQHYRFSHWTKKGKEEQVTQAELAKEKLSTNLTLVAHFDEYFKVTYTAGANGSLPAKPTAHEEWVKKGDKPKSVPNPTPNQYYEFSAWKQTNENGTTVNPKDTPVNADVTYVATFAQKQATITVGSIDPKLGTINPSKAIKVPYGNTLKGKIPTVDLKDKERYFVGGWTLTAPGAGSSKTYTEDELEKIKITGDGTLTPVIKERVKVTFEVHTVQGKTPLGTLTGVATAWVTKGETLKMDQIPTPTPSEENHTFKGWYNNENKPPYTEEGLKALRSKAELMEQTLDEDTTFVALFALNASNVTADELVTVTYKLSDPTHAEFKDGAIQVYQLPKNGKLLKKPVESEPDVTGAKPAVIRVIPDTNLAKDYEIAGYVVVKAGEAPKDEALANPMKEEALKALTVEENKDVYIVIRHRDLKITFRHAGKTGVTQFAETVLTVPYQLSITEDQTIPTLESTEANRYQILGWKKVQSDGKGGVFAESALRVLTFKEDTIYEPDVKEYVKYTFTVPEHATISNGISEGQNNKVFWFEKDQPLGTQTAPRINTAKNYHVSGYLIDGEQTPAKDWNAGFTQDHQVTLVVKRGSIELKVKLPDGVKATVPPTLQVEEGGNITDTPVITPNEPDRYRVTGYKLTGEGYSGKVVDEKNLKKIVIEKPGTLEIQVAENPKVTFTVDPEALGELVPAAEPVDVNRPAEGETDQPADKPQPQPVKTLSFYVQSGEMIKAKRLPNPQAVALTEAEKKANQPENKFLYWYKDDQKEVNIDPLTFKIDQDTTFTARFGKEIVDLTYHPDKPETGERVTVTFLPPDHGASYEKDAVTAFDVIKGTLFGVELLDPATKEKSTREVPKLKFLSSSYKLKGWQQVDENGKALSDEIFTTEAIQAWVVNESLWFKPVLTYTPPSGAFFEPLVPCIEGKCSQETGLYTDRIKGSRPTAKKSQSPRKTQDALPQTGEAANHAPIEAALALLLAAGLAWILLNQRRTEVR